MDDSELLTAYLTDRSEEAFSELVGRHMELVYSAALRQVGGDAHLAKDVVQNVFMALASKAAALRSHPFLGSWLYTSTHFAAAQIVRTERRRRARERAAQLIEDPPLSALPDTWDRLRPALDQVMNELSAKDRDAILLRYFENRPYADMGSKLALNEEAARKRADRALEKMRALLARRGVVSTATALAAILTDQAVSAAVPAGLAAEVSGAALAGMGSIGSLGLVQFMTVAKTNALIFAGIVALSVTAVLIQEFGNHELERESRELAVQDTRLVDALAASQRAAKLKTAQLENLSKVRAVGAAQAARPAASYALSPNYRRAMLQVRSGLAHDYAALFRRMHLGPEKQNAFAALLIEKQVTEDNVAASLWRGGYPGIDRNDMSAMKTLVTAGTADIDSQMRQEVGATLYGEYEQYTATLNYRNQINDFADQLAHTGSPLSDSQADSLVGLLANANTDAAPLPQSFAAEAAAILNPSQAPALKTLIGALQARSTILAMNRTAVTQGQPPLTIPGQVLTLNLQP